MRICTAKGYPGAVQIRFLPVGKDKQEEIMEKYIIAVDMDGTLASVDKGIHNKTTKYGLPTY